MRAPDPAGPKQAVADAVADALDSFCVLHSSSSS